MPDRGRSTIASRLLVRVNVTASTPSTVRSCSAGTFMGPGAGAWPGAGWGNAVDIALWNVTLPSTFCIVWWMCPFSTVTEPNGFNNDSNSALSCVPQFQFGYTVQSGMCANTTTGALLDSDCRYFLTQAN